MQARKTMHSLDGQHQDVTGLSVEESVRMTEERDKWRKYVHGVANRRIEDAAEEQNSSEDGRRSVCVR